MRLHPTLSRLAGWVRSHEPIVLFSVLAVATAFWVFIKLASEVTEGDTAAFDEWVVRSMRQPDDPAIPIGPPFVQEMGRDATALGGVGVLTMFIVLVSAYLWIDRKYRVMWFLISSTVSGVMVSQTLKHLFARERPGIVPHLSIVHTSSFPSGHSMLAATVYLTLGFILATVLRRDILKFYVLAVAVLLAIIVGVSRVYLGVHYPTDVLAGWIAGLGWAVLCWLIARWLQRRSMVEEADLITGTQVGGKAQVGRNE